jgi:uncharacterized RDD family membrane protein YckC
VSTSVSPEIVYVGFWPRVWATIIDGLLVSFITYPILFAAYGKEIFTSEALAHGPLDFLLTWVLPIVGTILFWVYKQATPGKLAIGARIVDARTGGKPTTWQFVGRYFGYFVSTLALCLGFVWVAFDPRKQAWHDKLAGTVVVGRP